MDPNVTPRMSPFSANAQLSCSLCHQPILPIYYFCPNCGTQINSAPLSTSTATQAWIYFQALILPMFLFLFISKWPAWRYYKSADPKLRMIGTYAMIILFFSTIATIWLTYESVQAMTASINASINADLGGL